MEYHVVGIYKKAVNIAFLNFFRNQRFNGSRTGNRNKCRCSDFTVSCDYFASFGSGIFTAVCYLKSKISQIFNIMINKAIAILILTVKCLLYNMKKFSASLSFWIAASHENPKNSGVVKKIMLAYKDHHLSGRIQMINLARLKRGKCFQAHYHTDMTEIFIILKGSAKIRIEKEKSILKKFDLVVIPSNTIHTMMNMGRTETDYLVIGISKGANGRTINVADNKD
ncbi:hypothetical protein A2Y99_05405 [Candidatus Gottesmanbacteria bacterium RBG_13_37_7]|uniref:Cupin type-2 domain-containing protein n=1 Tax=Candidatus Gottesmanbacteria bacterium RBG_13_37_7 TaxID=1798369 RepID=A0A1F5YHC7_9BACT|nr:MAG: hypothetical protein A2Y99_05405 [Candidatus Gottesmanbacteria bacterium RBG_13_37_7]